MTKANHALRDALEAEYHALRSGQFTDLRALATAKETALAQVPDDSEEWTDLARLASRNAALIKAALSGVAAARDRLLGHHDISLQTYSADGRRVSVRTSRPKLEQRR